MKKTILLVLVLALGLIASVANADFTFGTPTNLGPPVNTSFSEQGPNISADGLELYFCSVRPGGFGSRDLWVATRPTASDPWGEPINLGPTVNYGSSEWTSSISTDGLELFFFCGAGRGGYSGRDLWMTTRATKEDDWVEPVNLGPTVNSSADEEGSSISADGLSLFFTSKRPGGSGSYDLWVTTRATKNADWSAPMNLGPTVNSSAGEESPSISADGLWLFLHSIRPSGYGGNDIWVSTRATTDYPWGEPVNLGPAVNSSAHEEMPYISADGSTLYFSSGRPGGSGSYDLWQAPVLPIVDFNGDGIVDCADMCIMVDHWCENYSLCDICPTPFGDGIVDVQDLIVLAEHLFEEVDDPTLVAHWALDETEGDIASDSAIDNDGTVYGDPAWQPEGGMVDGALQLDGIDDYVNTPFVLNPADGKFSVFVWIKGGAPGQVILSQESGVNWLVADPLDGKLMTELKGTGRLNPPLMSESVVTDGDWHRVGFVRDGSDRILYVDSIEAARDTTTNLESSSVGLYIGAGSDLELEPSAFWSGLIDDVRIYNRAVTP